MTIRAEGKDFAARSAVTGIDVPAQAATLAGIPCIVIPTPLTAGGNFAAAVRVIDRVEDVPAALKDL